MLSKVSASSRSLQFVRSIGTAITHDWVHYIRTEDDPKPNCDKLTLYGHNLCPFVERVRLGLALKEVPYKCVELDLSQRPDWYYDMNPAGKVPTIQFPDGRVLYESDLILEVIDRIYQEKAPSLFPKEPVANALLKLKIKEFTKFIPLYYTLMRKKEDWETTAATLKAELQKIEFEIGQKTFFGGEKMNAFDLMIYPHLERFFWMQNTHLKDVYEQVGGKRLTRLIRYYERVLDQEILKLSFAEQKAHITLIEQLAETGSYQLRLPLMMS